ncbi:YceI family protein [Corynebacterium hindlerae]|uniref:YceI family protein n=1 Tax=Corynebacterium hindlerae TaxID=699041 RepID=UPI0031B6E181
MQQTYNKKLIIGMVVAIIVVALASVVPVAYKAYMTPGVKTEGIQVEGAKNASTDFNGAWHVVKAAPGNPTSVGYTFWEILPGERRATSGSTNNVTGDVNIARGKLNAAKITVDMTTIHTDREKRDINVRMKLLETDQFPTATFAVDEGAGIDVSSVPDNGTIGKVTVPGTLTIHGVSKHIQAEMEVLRTGDNMIVGANIPINRLDYGVETPDFVAAKIDTEGHLNIRIALEK